MALKPCQLFCLIKSSLGIFFGIFAFVSFFFWYTNYEAGIWAFTTAVIASISLHLHYLECRGQLSSWHSKETLSGIQHLGFIGTLLGSAYFTWYLFYGFYHHKGLYPVDTSPYIKSVWAFLTANYSMMLFITCKIFSQSVDSVPLLLDV